ncbi:MAG TPA: hypothetical protein ENO09_01705 [bacterium]|nr:hypothetical protein [bacterium]
MQHYPSVRAVFVAACIALGAGFPVAQAHELENYALIRSENLPHLMHNIMQMSGELQLSEAQRARLQEVARDMPPKMHAGFTRAQTLEKSIARDVVEQGRSAEDVSTKLDELQRIKRELTDLQIKGLNQIRAILTPEQYQLALKDAAWGQNVAK